MPVTMLALPRPDAPLPPRSDARARDVVGERRGLETMLDCTRDNDDDSG
jgi:hypothetical protein